MGQINSREFPSKHSNETIICSLRKPRLLRVKAPLIYHGSGLNGFLLCATWFPFTAHPKTHNTCGQVHVCHIQFRTFTILPSAVSMGFISNPKKRRRGGGEVSAYYRFSARQEDITHTDAHSPFLIPRGRTTPEHLARPVSDLHRITRD